MRSKDIENFSIGMYHYPNDSKDNCYCIYGYIDGKYSKTSAIIKTDGISVTTENGGEYLLLSVDKKWLSEEIDYAFASNGFFSIHTEIERAIQYNHRRKSKVWKFLWRIRDFFLGSIEFCLGLVDGYRKEK